MIKKLINILVFFIICTSLLFLNSSNMYIYKSIKTYSYSNDWPEILTSSELISIRNLNPKIVILDTGIDFTNPLIKSSNHLSIDISSDKTIDEFHGTEVAGVIVSQGHDLVGLLPKAYLISIKLGNEKGWTTSKLAEGLKVAISLKPDVINISSGTSVDDSKVEREIQEAYKNNIVIVAAAGNGSKDFCDYPAAYPNVLSVGAVDINYSITQDSNYSNRIKVFAPGEDILTTKVFNDKISTTRFSGTSASAPFVTCLAAAIKCKYRGIKASEVMNRIISKSNISYINGHEIKIINYNLALN